MYAFVLLLLCFACLSLRYLSLDAYNPVEKRDEKKITVNHFCYACLRAAIVDGMT